MMYYKTILFLQVVPTHYSMRSATIGAPKGKNYVEELTKQLDEFRKVGFTLGFKHILVFAVRTLEVELVHNWHNIQNCADVIFFLLNNCNIKSILAHRL